MGNERRGGKGLLVRFAWSYITPPHTHSYVHNYTTQCTLSKVKYHVYDTKLGASDTKYVRRREEESEGGGRRNVRGRVPEPYFLSSPLHEYPCLPNVPEIFS